MLSQLRSVFDLVIEFKLRQEQLHQLLVDEVDYQRRHSAIQAARTAQGQWALDPTLARALDSHAAEFAESVADLHGHVRVIATSMKVRA
jgi:hypothetical protein